MLYPKIETVFDRDVMTFKVNTNRFKDQIYSIIREWEFTEKIDGTIIRILKGNSLELGGRTEIAEVPKAIESYICDIISMKKLEEIFGYKDVVIFGEGYGGKIQAGERDKLRGGKYSNTEKFIVFDILVSGRFWLKRADIEGICENLGFDVVPILPLSTLNEACHVTKNGFMSILGDGSIKAEGMIGKTAIPLFDSLHRRVICKIKTEDFEKGKINDWRYRKKKELIEKIRYILLLENDDNCIDLMCYYLSYMYDCDDNLEDYIKKISEKIKNNLESLEKEASKKLMIILKSNRK